MNRSSAALAHPYHIPNLALSFDARAVSGDGAAGKFGSRVPPVHIGSRPRPVEARPKSRRGAGSTAPRRQAGGRLLAISLFWVCLLALTATLAGRERIVRMAPALAPVFAAIGQPVNLLGLAIEDVRARSSEVGHAKVLMVDGYVVNLRAANTAAPDLKITLRAADGAELYVWTARAPKSHLGASERVHFSARLEAPPEGIDNAFVNFVDDASGHSSHVWP